MKKINWREIFKFLSGAFFVTAGASWYFAWYKVDLPFMGTTMSHEFLAFRGFLHFVLFLLTLYFGFIRKSKQKCIADSAKIFCNSYSKFSEAILGQYSLQLLNDACFKMNLTLTIGVESILKSNEKSFQYYKFGNQHNYGVTIILKEISQDMFAQV